MSKLFAHSEPGLPEDEWEQLAEHLADVAKQGAEFCALFGAEEWGWVAGQLHDIGKAKPGFQARLRGAPQPEPHAAEGALLAQLHYAGSWPRPFETAAGQILAFAIAGHHSGLANGRASGGGLRPLDERLKDAEDVSPWYVPPALPNLGRAPAPLIAGKLEPFSSAFFTRMLFSALVDADRLQTERWFNAVSDDPSLRGWPGQIGDLKQSLDHFMTETFEGSSAGSDLARLRSEVLADCRAAADLAPGLFSLSVPTGGGKTLSSLSFALDHAIRHDLKRVIYVIPFTSIIEQTADVFGKALGDQDAILEHHSAFAAEKLERPNEKDDDVGLEKLRLAAQNWDRPIIVTTAVQFFESLFSNKPGRCRKLHNIARSVVILDEAQTLPIKLLRPCLAALNELARGYQTSVLLCTATQPAVTKSEFAKVAGSSAPPEALDGVREIIPADRQLYGRLKRVRANVAEQALSDAQLVEALSGVKQGLVIVNNRRHARELFADLHKTAVTGARHLTTAMTAAHRQHVLGEIRDDLTAGRAVRLVSTSLIEAGVDISFKAVWRAWAGLDQIVQAAGRCNRNGELGPDGGLLTIFAPEDKEGRGVPGELKQNAETAKRVLRDGLDPLSPEAVAAYFRELLWTKDDGGHWRQLDNVKVGESEIAGIIKAIDDNKRGLTFPFADIAQAFRMIDETMVPVIIPASVNPIAGVAKGVLDSIPWVKSTGGVARDLQRHIVQDPRRARQALIDVGSATVISPDTLGDQFVVLSNADLYDDDAGLDWSNPVYRTAESLML